MRRMIALLSVLGLFGAALGCQHIGGKNDCGAHPSDAVFGPPTNPYPYAPVGGVIVPAIIPPSNGKEPKKVGNEGDTLPMLEIDQLPAFKTVPMGK